MNTQDIIFLSTIINVMLGSVVVPKIVALIVMMDWKDSYKRWIAAGVSLLFATAQWYLTVVITGQGAWEGIAITGPIIYASATIAYTKYWKGKLGSLEEFDLIGMIMRKPKDE